MYILFNFRTLRFTTGVTLKRARINGKFNPTYISRRKGAFKGHYGEGQACFAKNRHAILRNKSFISLFPNIDKIAFHQRGRNDLQAPKQKPGKDSTTLKFVTTLACSVVQ